MNKIPCSVYIVTLNCGAWLERTLQSVSEFDEVIILDSGSTDNTYEIAKALKIPKFLIKTGRVMLGKKFGLSKMPK